MPNTEKRGMIASLSGIRGVLNKDVTLEELSDYAGNFVVRLGAKEVLLARDTRSTGPAIAKAVTASMMAHGANVVDYGTISTPALFRESRIRERPAVMVTASHNEPEFNGLKFILNGFGIGQEVFAAVVKRAKLPAQEFKNGSVRSSPRSRYAEDLVSQAGAGSCEGMRVALDLGGGSAISHAPQILRKLGCETITVNDTRGVFSRKVDPVSDDLGTLRALVKEDRCAIGLGFDCDGDRLVIVDSEGNKRSGDYMLTLALSELLRQSGEKKVVVSVDTTQAIDDVAEKSGAEVLRSKVGEANVVSLMRESGARFGGEGSSGGLIDGSFNYCRDSMLAAVVTIKSLKRLGARFYKSVPLYHQSRIAVAVPREKGRRGIKAMLGKHPKADATDGLKIWTGSRSWVLVRASGTEDIVRVSAEAQTRRRATDDAEALARELKELSR